MRREDVVSCLKSAEPEMRALGTDALFLFGSVARDEAGPDSDIDLFVDPDPARPFGYDEFMNVHELLQERLGPKASVTTREGLHQMLRSAIEKSSVRVF